MEKTPGLVAVTKFVRPGSAVYASWIYVNTLNTKS